MNKMVFSQCLNEIFSMFGRRMPDQRICAMIFKRVEILPDNFMYFAVSHFEDQEKLPSNMGYYLKRILWPEYLNKNPELRSNQYSCCPKCIQGMPGYRQVWEYEKTAVGNFWTPKIIRCTCGNAPNPRNERIFSDYELLQYGFSLDTPEIYKNRKVPDSFKNAILNTIPTAENHALDFEEYEF